MGGKTINKTKNAESCSKTTTSCMKGVWAEGVCVCVGGGDKKRPVCVCVCVCGLVVVVGGGGAAVEGKKRPFFFRQK